MNETPKKRHDCNKLTNGKSWMYCSACDGRVHEDGCTARMDPKKDCCVARHKKLLAEGHTFGLTDSSEPMWSEYWEKIEAAGMTH